MQIVIIEKKNVNFLVDTGRKLNVHKSLNLHPVSTGLFM